VDEGDPAGAARSRIGLSLRRCKVHTSKDNAILAAEARREDAQHLLECLQPLGWIVRRATSTRQVMTLLRREIFEKMVVAAEMTLDGKPLLMRLASLPALRRLIAIGPGGEPAMERRARIAGADMYLARPVTTDALAVALGLSVRSTASGTDPPCLEAAR